MNVGTSIKEDILATREQGLSLREILPDPRAIWALFRRNLTLFLVVFVLFASAVLAWTATRTPSFSSTASLLVQPRENVVNVQSVTPDMPTSTDLVDTRVRLVASNAVALRVAQSYAQLHPEIRPRDDAQMRELAASLLQMVVVARSGATYIIEVTATSSDPKKAAEVANLFVTQFVSMDKETKVLANVDADDWLKQRSSQLARDATAADAALQRYKIANGLLSANGRSGAENQISNLDTEIAQAEADVAEKQGRLGAAKAQLRSGGGGADVGAALGSGTIGGLRTNEAQVSAKLAQLSATYGKEYPDVVQTRQQLADIRQQIQLEINRILSNLDAETQAASTRLNSLRASRSSSNGVLATNNAAQVGLAELERKADAAKAIYETFLNRSRETSAQQGLQQADARIAQLAPVPLDPDFPNWKLALIFATAGGIGVGLLAIAIAEYLEGGIRSKADVEQRLRVRYAGSVPALSSILGNLRDSEPPHEYVVTHPFSMFAESLRSLRAFMLIGSGSAAGSARSIAVVSALPQEGKTTTAICLARVAALGGVRTVLVDCDLRRRGLSDLLNQTGSNGLNDYFEGKCTIEEALTIDTVTGLSMLVTSEAPKTAHELLTNENLSVLIAELKKRFDVIIIDTAPLLGISDSRAVAAEVDRVLLVTRWSQTPLRVCEAAIDLLMDAGAKLSGLALTQVNIRRHGASDATESFGYHKRFRGYYAN